MAWPAEAGALFPVPLPLPPAAPAPLPPLLPQRATSVPWRHRYYPQLRGKHRIFNAAGYRFYRSNSAPPEEGDTPFATSAGDAMPYEPTDTYADGTWYLALDYTNGIHSSGFYPIGPNGERYVRMVIASGAEVEEPPLGPLSWHLELRAGGVVAVVGAYAEATAALRADTWAIAYTTNGSTPAEDSPTVTVDMTSTAGQAPSGGLAVLDYDLPAQSNGTTVKVRLQTYRTSDTSYSDGSTVETATADASGPSAPGSGATWLGPTPADL